MYNLNHFFMIPIVIIEKIAPLNPIQNVTVNDRYNNPTSNTLRMVTILAFLKSNKYNTITVTKLANPILAPGTGMILSCISITFKTIAAANIMESVVRVLTFVIHNHPYRRTHFQIEYILCLVMI